MISHSYDTIIYLACQALTLLRPGLFTPFEDQSIFFILMIAPGWRQASGARSVPSGQRHDEISYPQPVITTRVQFKMVQGDLAGASPATTLASPTPAEWRPLRAPGWGKPSLPRKKMNRTLTTRHRCPGLSS